MKNLDKTLWIKRIFMVLMDICIVILTSIAALIVRFEFSLSAVPKYYIGVVWSSLPATLVIAIIVFYVFRLYSSLWVYAGVTELLYLAAACIVDTLLNTVTILLNYRDQEYPLPRDYKLEVLQMLLYCLPRFDPEQETEFLKYAKHYVRDGLLFCRMMVEAGSFASLAEYRHVRQIGAIYNNSAKTAQKSFPSLPSKADTRMKAYLRMNC